MRIIKEKTYIKDVNKKILKNHKIKEQELLNQIENLILDSENLEMLLRNPLSRIYHIEKKEGDLKEIYTARLEKLRLHMKPIGEYPYNKITVKRLVHIKEFPFLIKLNSIFFNDWFKDTIERRLKLYKNLKSS